MGKNNIQSRLQSKSHKETGRCNSEQSSFILKAYEIINSQQNYEIIHWSKSGYSFIIEDIQRFQQIILPRHFRHNRYQSFVRQLNMYDFHKVRNGDYYCENKSEFRHQEFYRSNFPQILEIKRKGFQEKPTVKEGTRKNHKNHRNNARKVQKAKKTERRQAKLQNPIEDSLIYEEELENKQNIEQVSVQIHLQNQSDQNQLQVANKRLLTTQQLVQKITGQVANHYNAKQLKYNQLSNQKKFNENIEIAELIKEKWSEQNCQVINDLQFMKEIYHKVKQLLIKCPKHQKQQQNNLRLYQSLFDLISVEGEEQIIIQSIFRKQIRSTLISINSETFLNHDQLVRADLLMNL